MDFGTDGVKCLSFIHSPRLWCPRSMAALCFCEILPQSFADLSLVGVPHSQIHLEKEELKKKKKKLKVMFGVVDHFPGWLKLSS